MQDLMGNHNKGRRLSSGSTWKFLVMSLVSVLLSVLTACMDAPTAPSPTATPIIIVVTATSEPLQSTSSPTVTSLPSPTTTEPAAFQSGGLGLTEQEWRSIAVPNLPKVPSINTNLADRHISEISIVWAYPDIDDSLIFR